MNDYIEKSTSEKGISLDGFLKMGDVRDRKKEVLIEKLSEKLIIRAMNEAEFNSYRRQSIIFDKKSGGSDLNLMKLRMTVLENHIVEPDFSNKNFLDEVGCTTAQDFFKRKFSPGVISDIYSEISKLSDFENDFEELAEEAKN